MNHKLVIIGNGFDLSHGLHLKYTDFLLNYLHKCLHKLNTGEIKRDGSNPSLFFNFYSDELITLKTEKWTDCGIKENWDSNINKRDWYEKLNISQINKLEDLIEIIKNKISINFKDDFSILEKLLNNLTNNWVDFESLYFDCLIELEGSSEKKIKSLNNQWVFIKSEFIEYLKYCQKEFDSNIRNYDSFKSYKVLKYLFDGYDFGEKKRPEFSKYYFLNFNFTNILKRLYNFQNIIQIHGNIDDNLDEILFGYGFRQNKNYSKILSNRINDFRVNLKDIYYSDRNNRTKLFEFIETYSFDVKIVGLSCGESDITLLDEIFNHENCKSIKIYSRDKNGFQTIRNNIFRFPSINIITNKILPYEGLKNNIIEQFNSEFSQINREYVSTP